MSSRELRSLCQYGTTPEIRKIAVQKLDPVIDRDLLLKLSRYGTMPEIREIAVKKLT